MTHLAMQFVADNAVSGDEHEVGVYCADTLTEATRDDLSTARQSS